MNTNRIRYLASLIFIGWMLMPNSLQPQEGGDKLVVHIRSAAVTLSHVALKDERLSKEVAASLEKVEGVTRTRILLASGMVEARFDTSKTTGEQVANAAKKILEEKLAGRIIEAQNLHSHKVSSKIFVKALASDRVQLTSERFY